MPAKKRLDRISKIMQLLEQSRSASIRDLSNRLSVSEMTIRRDLTALAAERKVNLVHAGAALASGPALDRSPAFSLTGAETDRASERRRIGSWATSLIESGDLVIIDAGSTTEWLARSIPAELPVTILCYALNILVEARRGAAHAVVFAGGELRADSLVFDAPEGVSLMRRYRANKAFISAGGASDKLGVTCADAAVAELKKAAMASSQTRILLADSHKFGRVSPAWFANLSDFDAIITDAGISLEYVEIVRELGITLHVV
jgi:DeoR family deoxyribose operon repressor